MKNLRVKDVARESLYCPNFVPSHTAFMESATKRHDKLKDKVKELLKNKYDVECEDEKEVNLPSGLRGKIDLLCRGKDRDLIVEVKSSYPSRLLLGDAIQLALYAYGYKKSFKDGYQKELDLYLAYRGSDGNPILIKIEEKLKRELEEMAKIIDFSLTNDLSTEKPKVLVLSFLCRFCGKDCPFKPRLTTQGA